LINASRGRASQLADKAYQFLLALWAQSVTLRGQACMNPAIPADAQQIVSQYLTLLEGHAAADAYPVSAGALPFGKETIKAAIRTSVSSLMSSHQLTSDMRDFLEVAYISLADYIDAELAALIIEYNKAAGSLAADSRPLREKSDSPYWQTLAQSGRLAAQIARAIADETEALRGEFRAFLSPSGSTGVPTP
jgi:hypothetical protein